MFEADDAAVLRRHAAFAQRLATAVFTRRPRRRLPELLRAGGGLVTINDAVLPSAHPGAPLAGHGPSGWGVTRGGEGLRAMTRPVVITQTPRWLRPPTRTPDDKTVALLDRCIGWWYR